MRSSPSAAVLRWNWRWISCGCRALAAALAVLAVVGVVAAALREPPGLVAALPLLLVPQPPLLPALLLRPELPPVPVAALALPAPRLKLLRLLPQ